MSVPKKRQTSSSRKKRAAHFALRKPNIQHCPNCKNPVVSHRACAQCGYYGGSQKIAPKKTKKKSS